MKLGESLRCGGMGVGNVVLRACGMCIHLWTIALVLLFGAQARSNIYSDLKWPTTYLYPLDGFIVYSVAHRFVTEFIW